MSMEQSVKDYINNVLKIKVHHVKAINRNESHLAAKEADVLRKVPYLRVYVYESDFSKIIGKFPGMGLANEDFSKKVIEFISGLDAQSFDRDKFYDPLMYIGVDSWEKYCYCDYAYNHKKEMESLIHKIIPAAPRGIYASTFPGVNIVYETDIYLTYNIGEYKDKIKSEITKAAEDFVFEKYGERLDKSGFNVNIWNPDMEGYNGYGIARQD